MGFPHFRNCKEYAEKLKELEKENAELKADFIKSCKVKEQGFTEAEQALERKDEQLTKAKEIIKNLLSAYISYADSFDDRDNQIVAEAEQFLKSEVVK